MPTYFAICDNCSDNIQANRYSVADIIKDCRWCGNDVCSSCKSSNDNKIHEKCLEEEKKSDEEEYNGN